MTKWIGAAVLLAAALLFGGSPAVAAAPSVEFSNVCGGVTVTTDAPDGVDVRISRNGKPAGGFALSGGSFTIAAHTTLTIGVAVGGEPEKTHQYFDPANCSNRNILTATFEDWCFGRIYIQLRNEFPDMPAFVITVNGTTHTVPAGHFARFIDALPDNALVGVYRDLPSGERGFYANRVYRTPTGCGASSLSARFVDHCYGVRVEVTSTASGFQTWSASHGDPIIQPAPWTRGNGTSAQQINGLSEGVTFTLKHLTPPDTHTQFATHTYRKPAECAAYPWQTRVAFLDTCSGTSVTVTSLGGTHQYFIEAGGRRREVSWPLSESATGASKTEEVQGDTVVVLGGGMVEGNIDRKIATHTYAKPAGCDAPLPVTGAGTATIAVGGGVVVLLGVAMVVVARRRRVLRE